MKTKFMLLVLSVTLIALYISCYASDIKTAVADKSDSNNKTYEDVFKKDNIIDVNIEIPDADLQDMYDHATNEEYHSADITVDGIKVENAGIRTKGNMTLSSVANSDSDRYSFRIKFNKYVKGQTFLGLDELCLNNGYSDATYMREYLHYDILENLGMNVPKRSFCNVYINGELFGFYLAVEAIDDTYLEREFGGNYKKGNLYKMDMGSTLEYKEDENYTYADLKLGKDTSLDEFKTFVRRLNDVTDGEKGDIEDFLNVESALKYIASNTVLCNYDSYNGNNHHNFYLYQDENGIFTVIPWDFNMSFGGFNGNNSTVGIDMPFISGSLETLPLIGKLLSVDEYKEKYYGYIKEIMTMLESFEDRVIEIKNLIKPYVENDPTAFYSVEDFEKATTLQDTDGPDISDNIGNDKPDSIDNTDKTDKTDNSQNIDRPENNFDDGKRSRGGQPFGGTGSIINCIADRLENLNEQFNGTAEKTTTSGAHDGGRSGGGFAPHDFADKMPDDFRPPQFDKNSKASDDFRPSEDGGNDRREPKGNDFQGGQESQNPPQQGNTPPNGMPPEMRNDRAGNDVIRVHLDGHIIEFDTSPVIENDTTLVGFRGILEALGAEVEWNEESSTVTATKDDINVTLTIGSDTAYVNDTPYTLLAAPIIKENSTMIPIRFISEQLGMNVSWNDETKLIIISSK